MADDKALSLNNGLPAIRNWAKEKFVGKEAGKGLSDNNYSTTGRDSRGCRSQRTGRLDCDRCHI